MNDFTKAFRMSCSVFPECNRDFQASVWTFPVVVAFARQRSGLRRFPPPGVDDGAPVHGRETRVNWLAIVLIVFVAFSWLMTLALCRAARLGDEMSARLADERRAAQQREEERP